MNISPRRKRQVFGLLVGLSFSIIAVVGLSLPIGEEYLSKGPMNTGHEELECISCHVRAEGSLDAQLKANLSWLFGSRENQVDFGMMAVDNTKCMGCHDRPNDRHPVYRFKEPRFEEARAAINPTECESCHLEHSGMRMTRTNTGFCVNCHSDIEMTDDPLDVSHKELAETGEWMTCLQCHDFHGNHIHEVATAMKDTISIKDVILYTEGGPSPYGDIKKYLAKENPDDPLKQGTK